MTVFSDLEFCIFYISVYCEQVIAILKSTWRKHNKLIAINILYVERKIESEIVDQKKLIDSSQTSWKER